MTGTDFVRLRADFPLLTKRINGHRLAYLDSAATTELDDENKRQN